MRGNQLPVSATRWQHGVQIFFATFIYSNGHKIGKNSTTPEARGKNKHRFGILNI
jgi:hypothetical protein